VVLLFTNKPEKVGIWLPSAVNYNRGESPTMSPELYKWAAKPMCHTHNKNIIDMTRLLSSLNTTILPIPNTV